MAFLCQNVHFSQSTILCLEWNNCKHSVNLYFKFLKSWNKKVQYLWFQKSLPIPPTFLNCKNSGVSPKKWSQKQYPVLGTGSCYYFKKNDSCSFMVLFCIYVLHVRLFVCMCTMYIWTPLEIRSYNMPWNWSYRQLKAMWWRAGKRTAIFCKRGLHS